MTGGRNRFDVRRTTPYEGGMPPSPGPLKPDIPVRAPAPDDAPGRARMPLSVYVLALSVFALGTSEFMLSGLLPAIARDMRVTIPRAGLLISAFAIGMVVGAPLLAVATLRLPRRTTLVALVAVFGLGQVAGALAPDYPVLFASRIVSALACAGFWAVGAAVAVAAVPATSRARALAVMIGGLSVANVLGVPVGAFLGEGLGWRAAFWAVAAASAVALAGILALVPPIAPPSERPRLRRELFVYRDGRVWLSVTTIALTAAGVFCAFSYLAPLLTDVAGLDESRVPTVLALFGVGALVGTAIGGRFADAHPFRVLLGGMAADIVVLVAFALLGRYAVAAVPLSFLLGVACFSTAPALNARMFHLAAAAPTLAGATTTAAFNLGNTAGPWLGGAVIDAGLGYRATAWVGAVLTTAAVGLTLVALRTHRRAPHARTAGTAENPVRPQG